MDPEIERIERKALSDADLRKILGNGTKIIKYSELSSVSHLPQLLPGNTDYCVILYETAQNSGHWTALLRYRDLYEFFDPYGYMADKELLWIPAQKRKLLKQGEPYLTELLEASGAHWIYNKKRFEKMSSTINTCGSHCAHRIYHLMHNHMDLKDYVQYMERTKAKTGNDYDIIVAAFVNNFI